MNTVSIHDINQDITNIMSFADTAMYLNLFHHELVEEILESFTDLTDAQIIAEIIDTLNLPITCVIEHNKHGDLIHGYITKGGVLV